MNTYPRWSEKYQPQSLDECILEGFAPHVQGALKKFEKAPAVPNLLLYGIAGTGKSTIARLLADGSKYDVIWMNGSLFKKENVAELVTRISGRNLYDERRLVFIDEADGISQPAQFALRSAIDPRHEASWILTCNYRKKLIEPIASRFMQVECSLPTNDRRALHVDGIAQRCQQILVAERIIGIPKREVEALVNAKYPDIRQTINELQLRYEYLAEAA